jgi:hypothetical protein
LNDLLRDGAVARGTHFQAVLTATERATFVREAQLPAAIDDMLFSLQGYRP